MAETTEKIVESYVRYVKRWATISNTRRPDQREINRLDESATVAGTGKHYVMDDTIRALQMLVYAQQKRGKA